MTLHWGIRSWPDCKFDVFLSHCAEDREDFVIPLYEALQAQQIRPWLDRHNYPYGVPSAEALRKSLMDCRHVVYIVTDEYFRQARGWTAWEAAYADFVDKQLCHAGHSLLAVQLPLFFLRTTTTSELQRSIWGTLRALGPAFDPEAGVNKVDWAVTRIQQHLMQAQRFAGDLGLLLKSDPNLTARMEQEQGLRKRVLYR